MDIIKNKILKHRYTLMWFIDLLIISLAYVFAYYVHSCFIFDQTNFDVILKYHPIVLLIYALWMVILKVNKSVWKFISIEEVIRISIACIISFINLMFLVLAKLIPINLVQIIIIAAIFANFGLLALRITYRYIRLQKNKMAKKVNALIIGAGSAGVILSNEILHNLEYDYRLIGFIDDDKQKLGKLVGEYAVLGAVNDLLKIVRENNIQALFIAMPSVKMFRLKEILNVCKETHLPCKILSLATTDVGEKLKLRNVNIDDLLGRGEINLNDQQIRQYINDKVIMVTGGGGSIGSELCRQIFKYKPKKLIIFDIYENNMYDIEQELLWQQNEVLHNKQTEIICLIGSVRDKERVDDVLEKYHPDVLYHAAAHKHVPLVEFSPIEAIKNNIFGTKNVVESCIEHQVAKFILISSDKAVNPTNVMGATKRMCELIVQAYRTNSVTSLCAVRFGNVLGSHGSVIPLFKKQILEGDPVLVTDPEIKRYFMTIPEASQLVLQAGFYAKRGDIFVLDMGKPVKILDLAVNLISLLGYEPYKDIEIKFIGLRPGEKMFEELSLATEECYKTANNLIYVNKPIDINVEQLNCKLDNLKKVLKEDKIDNNTIIKIIN